MVLLRVVIPLLVVLPAPLRGRGGVVVVVGGEGNEEEEESVVGGPAAAARLGIFNW